jgi:hypothetical protein
VTRTATWRAAIDLALVAATIGLGVVVARQQIEFGSTAGRWTFRYLGPLEPRVVLIALVAAIAVAVVHEVARRNVAARPWLVVPAVFASGVGVQLALHALSPYTLANLLASDVATGFYGAAARTSPLDVLTNFDRVTNQLPWHARVNMPGKILLFHALRALTPAPQLQAIAIVVLSSLAGLALYPVVAWAFADRRIGLDAMTLWLVVPSKVAFHPLPNVVTPLPAIAAVWCMVRFFETRNIGWALAAGALAYATVLFDPLALWIGVAFAPLALHAVASRGVRPRAVVAMVVLALGSLAACHAAVVLMTGFDVVKRLGEMVEIVRDFNQRWARPRDVWIVANLKDVVLALGPAVSGAAVAAGGAALWQLARATWTLDVARALAPGPLLAVAALAVLGVLDAICLNRGEVARLWIVLYLPLQVAAAWWACDRLFGRSVLLAGTVAWAAITIATVGYCIP